MSENIKTATEQAEKDRTPDGRFTFGNKPKTSFRDRPQDRHNGSWHKKDTARYQMQEIMKLDTKALEKKKDDEKATTFERAFANILYLSKTATDVEEAKKCMEILEKMTNQVYGPMPAVQINVEADDETNEETNKIIKGFLLP